MTVPGSEVVIVPIQTVMPAPDSAAASDAPRRDLTVVDDKLHRLHLLLNDKQTSDEIAANFLMRKRATWMRSSVTCNPTPMPMAGT